MNALNNKIISRFYVITLNQKPVYVGYTNRPIKQRFNEHKRDKDFGKIQPEIQQIAQLEYPFTWDTNKIDQYAKEVNDKECELIKQYNTKNSKYQKANGGGQNWNDIKHFVNTNHNNPKFLNMPEYDVLKRIENEHNINKYLISFQTIHTAALIYMQSFIQNMHNPETQYINDFIRHLYNPPTKYMQSFIKDMHNPATQYMKTFINHMYKPASKYMQSFIADMYNPATQYMKNFTNHIYNPPTRYIKDCINDMKEPTSQYMKSFVTSMHNPPTRYIKSFVTHMHNPATEYMQSFIKNMH